MKKKIILVCAALAVVAAGCAVLISGLSSPEEITSQAVTKAAVKPPSVKEVVTPVNPAEKDAAEDKAADSPSTDNAAKTTDTKKPEEVKKEAEMKKVEEPAKAAETSSSPAPASNTPSLPQSSTGIKAIGLVSGSDVRMRSQSNTNSSILATLAKNTAVAVTGSTDGWYQISYNGNSGYMSADYLTVKSSASGLSAYGKVKADTLNVRSGASSGSSVVSTVSNGTYVDVTGFENGWFAISANGTSGYVSGDYLMLVSSKGANPSNTSTATDNSTASSTTDTPGGSATGNQIAATAQEYLGCEYTYGGSGPSSFDCSGLTMYVYGLYGISLPHGATGQYGYGTSVDQSNLQPGDLVFFSSSDAAIGHVGIYIGNRQFVHASTYNVGVITSSLDSGSYPSRYVGARRLV